jgi:hypothetical protein
MKILLYPEFRQKNHHASTTETDPLNSVFSM